MRKKVLAEESIKQGLNKFQFVERPQIHRRAQEGAIIRTVSVHCICTPIYAKEHPTVGCSFVRCWINCSLRTLPPGGGICEGYSSGYANLMKLLTECSLPKLSTPSSVSVTPVKPQSAGSAPDHRLP